MVDPTQQKMTREQLVDMRTMLYECVAKDICGKYRHLGAAYVIPEVISAMIDLAHHLTTNNLGVSDDDFLLMCRMMIKFKEQDNGTAPAPAA